MRWIAVLLLSQALAAAPPLKPRMDRLLDSSPAARRAYWGVHVVDLASGKTLYARNDDRFFVPASNTKLFSTALALLRLGPEHRFRTLVVAEKAPDAAGCVAGDLVLYGGGDPTLSGRPLPYRKNAASGDPLGPIEELAGQVAARGVRRIEGDLVGDDTAYLWDPYPAGWAQSDTIWEYGAPVSALTVNDNTLALSIRPGAQAGDPARLEQSPPLVHYQIENRVRTVERGERKIRIDRPAGSREVRVWGSIPRGDAGTTQLLAIDDPALFAALALREALERKGIGVRGRAVARHRAIDEVEDPAQGVASAAPAGVELARRESAPLLETLRVVNKISQNLQAELVLREVGRVRRGVGSRQAGLEELKAMLAEAGAAKEDYHFEDGSGLSRLTLITPALATRLLRFVWRSPHGADWVTLLPVGGEDGTLASRFEGQPSASRIHAKTGSLSHVSALSGYIERAGKPALAFSVIVNNYNSPPSETRRVIDRIGLLLAE
ncbi:MAG: D-alanyl-D-alanine carboxypeptidase/D-alanyl-D-alanine-endopeptidase [Acidobacteria bacterium]|nr:D-alanyl-D-alanine carboxypeptidase/D-alanyl-D-alanine-endopeptidase [Acidobacteriota bacterium]